MSIKQLARRNQKVRNPFLGTELPERIRSHGFIEIGMDPRLLLTHVPIIKDGMRNMTEGDDAAMFADYVISIDEMGWEHNSGLVRRTDDEQKWFFHCYEATYSDLRLRGAPVHKYREFFNSLAMLNTFGIQLAASFSAMFDDIRRPTSFSESLEFKMRSGLCVTRVLRYLPRNNVKADAKIHLDRNGVTIHWWSSRAGLVLFGPDLVKHRVQETQHDRICLFPGKKFAGATDGAFGSGAPHGVLDTSRGESNEDRFAIVTFVHPRLSRVDVRNTKKFKLAFDDLEERCKL